MPDPVDAVRRVLLGGASLRRQDALAVRDALVEIGARLGRARVVAPDTALGEACWALFGLAGVELPPAPARRRPCGLCGGADHKPEEHADTPGPEAYSADPSLRRAGLREPGK